MIVVSPYQSSYYELLEGLHLSQHVLLQETGNTLPEIGYIATEGSIAIAAGFLRRIEGGFGMIDTLVSNASLDGTIRHDGISQVVSRIILKAKELEIKGLICSTKDEGIIKRAKSIGFHETGEITIALKI